MTFVDDREIELDEAKVAGLPERVVTALAAVSRFEGSDRSVMASFLQGWPVGGYAPARAYPAGYVEDLIAEIKTALTGEEPDAEASQD